MKTVCIYHSIDLDGWMSAAIVKHWHNSNEYAKECYARDSGQPTDVSEIDFIGYNYGNLIPDLSEYDKVIMCDISFPKEVMSELWHNLSKKLIYIDHHMSAITDNKDLVFEGLQDVKFAACELTWKYFFPHIEMPEIVRLLGRYDCFGYKGTDEEQKVLEFQYGARECISNYEDAYGFLIKSINKEHEIELYGSYIESSILDKGKSIYQYLCTDAKQSYKNGFEVYFDIADEDKNINTFTFICINKERFNPINFGINYHKDGYDGAACFHYANDVWNFSLYNDNGEVDCSIIAKQYGGGGHKGASGFRVNDITTIIK